MAKLKKLPKTRKVEVKYMTREQHIFYLYKVEPNGRKYLGSVAKWQTPDGCTMFCAFPESWTWKRGAAMRFGTKEEARMMGKLIRQLGLRVEEEVTITELATI